MPFAIDAIHKGKSPSSAVDPYHSEIANSDSVSQDTGILLALFAAGLLLGSPLLGYLGNLEKKKKFKRQYFNKKYKADRMNNRQLPMVVGISGLLGATLLFLFATKFWELLLARFLQGFSDACVWTLGMCLVADSFPIEELGTQVLF